MEDRVPSVHLVQVSAEGAALRRGPEGRAVLALPGGLGLRAGPGWSVLRPLGVRGGPVDGFRAVQRSSTGSSSSRRNHTSEAVG